MVSAIPHAYTSETLPSYPYGLKAERDFAFIGPKTIHCEVPDYLNAQGLLRTAIAEQQPITVIGYYWPNGRYYPSGRYRSRGRELRVKLVKREIDGVEYVANTMGKTILPETMESTIAKS